MNKIKQFFKYILYFEKPRHYHGGCFRFPVRITQKFWDDCQATREDCKKLSEESKQGGIYFPVIDLTLGTSNPDFDRLIGKRPVVPDWIVDFRRSILICTSSFGWLLILGYLFYYFTLK